MLSAISTVVIASICSVAVGQSPTVGGACNQNLYINGAACIKNQIGYCNKGYWSVLQCADNFICRDTVDGPKCVAETKPCSTPTSTKKAATSTRSPTKTSTKISAQASPTSASPVTANLIITSQYELKAMAGYSMELPTDQFATEMVAPSDIIEMTLYSTSGYSVLKSKANKALKSTPEGASCSSIDQSVISSGQAWHLCGWTQIGSTISYKFKSTLLNAAVKLNTMPPIKWDIVAKFDGAPAGKGPYWAELKLSASSKKRDLELTRVTASNYGKNSKQIAEKYSDAETPVTVAPVVNSGLNVAMKSVIAYPTFLVGLLGLIGSSMLLRKTFRADREISISNDSLNSSP